MCASLRLVGFQVYLPAITLETYKKAIILHTFGLQVHPKPLNPNP